MRSNTTTPGVLFSVLFCGKHIRRVLIEYTPHRRPAFFGRLWPFPYSNAKCFHPRVFSFCFFQYFHIYVCCCLYPLPTKKLPGNNYNMSRCARLFSLQYFRLFYPRDVTGGLIIGRGGETIKAIGARTGETEGRNFRDFSFVYFLSPHLPAAQSDGWGEEEVRQLRPVRAWLRFGDIFFRNFKQVRCLFFMDHSHAWGRSVICI